MGTIIELFIDDYEGYEGPVGVDGVALVKLPAHEENWMAFSEDKKEKELHEILSEEEMYELGEAMGILGEEAGYLESQGYEIVSVKPVTGSHKFVGDISSKPNEVSVKDTVGMRVRYKYVGPRDGKNRDFCKAMLEANRVYRIEDIQRMTDTMANDDFGKYDIFKLRDRDWET